MNSIPLELAYARLGVSLTGSRRPLCAMAADGTLVMVCQSTGFNRPGPGVMRYSATLSLLTSPRSQVEALRASLAAAVAAETQVRLIVQTRAADGSAGTIHTRADLIGNVSAFDGDAFSVDFSRMEVEEEEDPDPPKRGRRRG
jgi:hypothetical protein